jgi:cobyric acid synthase
MAVKSVAPRRCRRRPPACLSSSERARIQGFVINRFRGDIELLLPGLAWLEQKTGKPVFGALPFVLPGSKSVQADLDWLVREGWVPEIRRHLRYGSKLIGI